MKTTFQRYILESLESEKVGKSESIRREVDIMAVKESKLLRRTAIMTDNIRAKVKIRKKGPLLLKKNCLMQFMLTLVTRLILK